MRLIRLTFNDGSVREFRHEGRGGGSWTKRLELKDGWAVVIDEYDNRTAFPEASIKEIETRE